MAKVSGYQREQKLKKKPVAVSVKRLVQPLVRNGDKFSCSDVKLRTYQMVYILMDTLAKKLDNKLREWQPDVVEQVRQTITEIIDLADQDVLDILRSRSIEQEVLDLIDEPETW